MDGNFRHTCRKTCDPMALIQNTGGTGVSRPYGSSRAPTLAPESYADFFRKNSPNPLTNPTQLGYNGYVMRHALVLCTFKRDLTLPELAEAARQVRTGTVPEGFWLSRDGDRDFTPVPVPSDIYQWEPEQTVDGRYRYTPVT